MHIDALLWMFLPVIVAGGSALLSYYVMQAKMEVALAKERETLAEARATITSHKVTMEERIKASEEATRRQAMDSFMAEIRVEERSYVRESRSASASKKSMVMQERLFFRNIPLSNWIEHEMVVEEGNELEQLPKPSVFAASPSPAKTPLPFPSSEGRLPISAGEGRLSFSTTLDDFRPLPPAKPRREAERESAPLVPARVAFGAQ
jgi:hypothetical protein